MAELLLELLSEDIPARMQKQAAEDLKRLVTERIKEERLTFTRAEAYVTLRRLALVVHGLPDRQPDVTEEKKGPRADAPAKAIEGFKRSLPHGARIEKRETDKGTFLFAVVESRGRFTTEVLHEGLYRTLWNFPWPKSMRWRDLDLRWVRPIQGLLVVFGGKVVHAPIPTLSARHTESLDHPGALKPTNTTRGHRFLAPGAVTVKDFADYKAKLKEAKVILDPAERRKVIWKEAWRLAKAEGLAVKEDRALLDEVAAMVEWPKVLIGRIDEAFMDLPPEVLTIVLRHNQKYFSLLRKDGSLAPRFIVVADTEPDDGGRAIVAGNERVLRARLADARYFWDHDRRTKLEDRVPALKDMIFHARLGTVADRVMRLETLSAGIASYLSGANVDLVRSAAFLCKADLTTDMVGEFPELQGVMGKYYALAEGERREVADAIAEHYSPVGPGDRCPTAPVSVALALADKLDTLVGFFGIGERPTGSKDPFALRRAALGAIRLILENGLRLPLRRIFAVAHGLYTGEPSEEGEVIPHGVPPKPESGIVRREPKGFPSRPWGATPFGAEARGQVIDELLEFLADRLRVHLRERGVRHDLINAAFAVGGEDDLVRLLARVRALGEFLESEEGSSLLIAYRRAGNIVDIEEKKDGIRYDGAVVPEAFTQDEEAALFDRLTESKRRVMPALKQEEFGMAMQALVLLRKPLDAFFDEVTVNCEDPDRRANRLRLLSQIRASFGGIADFSKVEG